VGILTCIDATKSGDVTKNAKIWSYDQIHRSLSTVSIDPDTGLLFVGISRVLSIALTRRPASFIGRTT